jgi:phospholipid/cholesterol/gamma-HCH transport system substrate-binding protein
VDAFSIIHEGNKNIQVKFHLEGGVELPADTKVKLVSSGLLGSMNLDLIPGNSNTMLHKGDTLQALTEPSMTESIAAAVSPLKDKVQTLLVSLDTTVTGLNSIIDAQTRQDLKNTLHNVATSSSKLDNLVTDESGRLKEIMANVSDITRNVKNYNKALSHAVDNISDITDTLRAMNLKRTIEQVNTAIGNFNSVLTDVQNGKGSLGKLMKDDKLYYNLQSASKNLDLLIRDIKIHPDRYLNFSVVHIGKKYTPSPADTGR